MPRSSPSRPPHDGGGYWLAGRDGGIFGYGDAGFFGSAGALPLHRAHRRHGGHPDGDGYWLVASDGGVFNYGDAGFFGSAGSLHLNAPSSAWRRPMTAGATGWWPRTGASSATATPPSPARPAPSTSTRPWSAWRPPPTAGATGWWPATAASSPTAGRLRGLGRRAVPRRAGGRHGGHADGDGYWLVARDGGIFTYVFLKVPPCIGTVWKFLSSRTAYLIEPKTHRSRRNLYL